MSTLLQWVDLTGKKEPLRAKPGVYQYPSLSPDGMRVALPIIEGGNSDVWVYDPQRDAISNSTPVCTVLGVNVTLIAAGTCSITASQPGNSTWAAATSVTRTFAVEGESQTITFGALSNQTLGTAPFDLRATATSALTVTFASNSKTICTVSGVNGVNLTPVKVGACSITASQAGNSTYAAAPSVTRTFTVEKAP